MSKTKSKGLVVKRVPIDSVYEDPANARRHSEKNLSAIEGSLRHFGQVEPLVVQESTGKVIGGNGRLAKMRELGWAEVDVTLVDVDDERAKSLAIALNRTAELGDWDSQVLADMLEGLSTGDRELDDMLEDLARAQALVLDDLPQPGPPLDVAGPASFPVRDESIPVESVCPKCGYCFSGGQKLVRA